MFFALGLHREVKNQGQLLQSTVETLISKSVTDWTYANRMAWTLVGCNIRQAVRSDQFKDPLQTCF